MKRNLSLMICMAMLLSILAACAQKEVSPASSPVGTTTAPTASSAPIEVVKLKFFTGKVETVDLMNQLIDKFNKQNPGIVVEQEYQKDAANVMKVKFASGDVPDITTVFSQEYIDQVKYLDLSTEPYWSRILPAIKDLTTDIKTGKQFRVATNVTMAGIFYNKKIFTDLGLKEALTWNDFKANLQTIKDKKPGVTPMFIAGKENWTLGHLIEFLAHGVIKQKYGVNPSRQAFINNESDKLAFDAPGGSIDTFAARLLELKKDGLINKDTLTATYDNQKEDFAAGKVGVISQGMWVLGDLLKMNPDLKDTIGFSPFPAIADGTKPVTLSAEDSAYLITTSSKHKEEAKKFLNFLFQPENMKQYSEFLKSPSAFKDVTADWGPLKDQAAAALQTGVNISFTDTPAGFSGDDAGRMVQDLLVGKYKTTLDFAKAYKETWDKAWNATNKK
ncbi:raffinose/stachyose/melibiose transport system substrate-binding protein [Paenibacillus sp. yr247]|uniref:ABC transporter substrate-binding protein n=1 Tax=Paenibacillus sp. yr247 TaxID=1761880 RepID=UPI00088D7410|nr:extracellular solute-binding protein [Paenibacillus sp. yr247]SDN52376.1 raffinose/stachyose/melibiose transport system substrate-binding protein [Paenibacillus sp. yr247]